MAHGHSHSHAPQHGSPHPLHAKTNHHAPPETLTVVHVTHEAIEHMGGIGTVLQGLLTARAYRAAVKHDILVGPLPYADAKVEKPIERLGPYATVCHYSGPDNHDPSGFGAILRPVEWAFGVKIVYGTRVFHEPGASHDHERTTTADVLLIDVNKPDATRLGALKWMLWERFGVDSRLYEYSWDYEEYCRLADPAYHALCALLHRSELPAVLISHEFMGMATALRCATDRTRFRTVFHAHECSTARRICEALPGHDAAFYPAMRAAMQQGRHVEQVFGSQADFARHALVSRAHNLDVCLAVGPETKAELQFLNEEMTREPVKVAYNGLPAPKVTWNEKQQSRTLVNTWLKNVLGFVPDYLFTHVTRPVPSKGLWRDQKLGLHLEPMLRKAGKTAAYVLLTCGANVRNKDQADQMARAYGWPAHHREGFPDLAGAEIGLYRGMEAFSQRIVEIHGGKAAIRPILVNQFGFSRDRLGDAAPDGMTVDDLRRAADLELGMSVYEPFGIAMLEPLHAGGVCVVSSVCGCVGLVQRAMRDTGMSEQDCPLVLIGDFTHGIEAPAAPGGEPDLASVVHMPSATRNAIEERVCADLAAKVMARLPRHDDDRRRYLEIGQALASKMSWDHVVETDFMPALRAIVSG